MKKTINDLILKNKKVIIREDLNVPMNGKTIVSNARIVAALPTIQKAIDEEAKVIILSHLGRIKDKSDLEKKSLKPVAEELARLLNKPVKFISETKGKNVENAIKEMKPGDVIMLENTRFEDLNKKAESSNNPKLGKYWASLADVFINDAFATSHRSHASNVGIATNIKESALGYLVQKEINNISKAIENPQRPAVAIIGGAKISDKIKTIKNLIDKVDKLIIGGGMSYTFAKAQGINIGDSIVENDRLDLARDLLKKYQDKIILPIDFGLSIDFANTKPIYNKYNSLEIPSPLQGMDMGPKTVELFTKELQGAKTVIWNGPIGVTEFDNYSYATEQMALAIGNLQGAYTVVGGGDSIAAINKLKLASKFSHISTGGGACLAMLEGGILPAIKVIQNINKPKN